MSNDDFDRWIAYHVAAFPGLKVWLDQNGHTLTHWINALEDVAYDDAKRATDLIFRGDDERPEGWSEHPSAVRKVAKRLAAKRIAEREREQRQTAFEFGSNERRGDRQKWTMCGAFATIEHYMTEAAGLGLEGRDQIDYATAKAWPDIEAGRQPWNEKPLAVPPEPAPPAIVPSPLTGAPVAAVGLFDDSIPF